MRAALACRLLGAAVAMPAGAATWTAAASDSWNNAGAWTPSGVPNGAGTNATIGALGSNYTIALNTSPISLGTLSMTSANATLDIVGAGQLSVQTGLTLQAGTIMLVGGGKLTANLTGNGTLDLLNGTLNASTVGAPVDVDGSDAGGIVTGGLTLANGTVSFKNLLGSGTPLLTFQGNQTLSGNGTVYFDQAEGGVLGSANGTLTLGAKITITTRNGNGNVGVAGTGRIINQGTLAPTANHTLALDGNWTNQGTLLVAAGTLYLGGLSAQGT